MTLIAYEQPSPSGARKTETVASPSALEYALPSTQQNQGCQAVVLLLSYQQINASLVLRVNAALLKPPPGEEYNLRLVQETDNCQDLD